MEKYLDKNSVLRLLQGLKTQIDKSKTSVLDTKGVANGIASLDAGGNVHLSQLGNLDTTFFEIVTELPTDIRNIKKHIYILKGNKDGQNNKYAEYIYTGDLTDAGDLAGEVDASNWEKLGDFVPTFDLQEYVKKAGAVAKLEFYDPVLDNVWNGDYDQPSETAIRIEFADGSHQYLVVPKATAPTNTSRSNSELSDSEKSKPFIYPGSAGFMSPSDKGKLDKIDLNSLTASITAANTAADNTNEAIRKCEVATAGAEKCNVTMEGTKIIVTNREGEKQETEVVNTEEVVTVVITSSVESISVAGLKVNVFLNNGKTPQTYTTDSEAKTTFKVSRGVYYQVAVPEYANAQPLSPIGFTSVGVSKTITFNYEPYDEETSEKVIVTVTKYTDGNGAPWESKEVIVTIDNKATTYTTDEKGQATIYVPYLKEYTVRVDDEDGYYVRFNKNSRTYTSRVAQRLIQVNMYQFKTGIYVLDSDATEYYIEDWVAAGKSADEAVAIKVADQNLRLNRGTFVIRCNDLKDMTKLQKYQWCTQNLQFTSIALNGNTSSDPNYWNGEQSSFLVRQEAEERSLSVPVFAFAYGQSLEIGGETLNGFLMSVGQEYVHISNAGTIREVLRALFGDSVADAYYKFVNGQSRWTSTQNSATNAWSYTSQAFNYNKYNSYYVLPVFAC